MLASLEYSLPLVGLVLPGSEWVLPFLITFHIEKLRHGLISTGAPFPLLVEAQGQPSPLHPAPV